MQTSPSNMEINVETSQKPTITILYDPTVLLNIYSKDSRWTYDRDTCMFTLIVLFTIAKLWN